nr:hypothetical protein [Angustibacter aerolatus]
MLVVGAPLRHGNRLVNAAVVVHKGQVLGVAPKSYLPNYREFYERRHFQPGDDLRGEIVVAGASVPLGPDLLFAAEDVPGLVLHVEVCEDLWVPVPPSALAALAGATVLANLSSSPVTVGRAAHREPAGALGVRPLHRGVRVRGRRRRRVDERPGVGRSDAGARERRAARRGRAVRRGRRRPGGGRRRPRPAAQPAPAQREPSTTTGAPCSTAEHRSAASGSGSTRRPATSGCGASSSASRSCRRTPTGSSRTATRRTTSRSPGWCSDCAPSAARRP